LFGSSQKAMSGWFTSFLNCRLCIGGKLVEDQLVVSDDTGLILPRTGYIGGDAVDLEEGIIAPGLLELHTNGLLGFHFTHFNDEKEYAGQIDKAAKFLVTQGVTGFWATIPTVSSDEYKKVGHEILLSYIHHSALRLCRKLLLNFL
jgi:N-acetylglucosamine-6-phosphate deacetylase